MYRKIRSFTINVLLLPFYWISFLIPRKKNIWVFGAWFGHSYMDNSKWLFESVCQREPRIRAIWLTRNREIMNSIRQIGLEAYMINSWKGYWLSCRAGLAVSSCGNTDINRIGISRAQKLQLWHGSPMKKIGKDDKFTQTDPLSILGILRKIWRPFFPFALERWDVVITASEFFKEFMASAFGIRPAKVKVTGYPRNDVLRNSDPPSISFIEDLKKAYNAKNVILYAPTHRQEGRDSFNLINTFDFAFVNKVLSETNSLLLIKMHYYHQGQQDAKPQSNASSRIFWLSKDEIPEINPLLNYTDILITDYSSVYFDYLILDRPVVFAPFDLEDYLAGDREMYDDYRNFTTAGPKCRDWDEVMEKCREILNGNDKYKDERKLAQQKYNSFIDANNCARVIELAKNMVKL